MEDNKTYLYINNCGMDESAKKVLENILSSNFKTVFVGAVHKIELEFGSLWGESEKLDEENMTSEQRFWYEKFLKLRSEIFDQGNTERKKAISMLKNFNVQVKS
jgi:hypothetical protein